MDGKITSSLNYIAINTSSFYILEDLYIELILLLNEINCLKKLEPPALSTPYLNVSIN